MPRGRALRLNTSAPPMEGLEGTGAATRLAPAPPRCTNTSLLEGAAPPLPSTRAFSPASSVGGLEPPQTGGLGVVEGGEASGAGHTHARRRVRLVVPAGPAAGIDIRRERRGQERQPVALVDIEGPRGGQYGAATGAAAIGQDEAVGVLAGHRS